MDQQGEQGLGRDTDIREHIDYKALMRKRRSKAEAECGQSKTRNLKDAGDQCGDCSKRKNKTGSIHADPGLSTWMQGQSSRK